MSAQRFSASRPGQHCRQASTNIQLVAAWLPAAAPCLPTSASVQLQCCGQTSGWPQAQVRHQGRQQALDAGLVTEARGAAGASVKQEAAVQRAPDLGQQSGVVPQWIKKVLFMLTQMKWPGYLASVPKLK